MADNQQTMTSIVVATEIASGQHGSVCRQLAQNLCTWKVSFNHNWQYLRQEKDKLNGYGINEHSCSQHNVAYGFVSSSNKDKIQ